MRYLERSLIPLFLALTLVAASCGGSTDSALETAETVEAASTVSEPTVAAAATPSASPDESTEVASEATAAPQTTPSLTCAETAALFVTKGSVNPSLADPEVEGSCTGDVITVTANGIPDYTYIETSPGNPRVQDLTFVMPYVPTATTSYTDVPLIGPIGVAINGVPIYGPTEGQGGDVLAGDALSECGSHNGPGGFHIHLFGTSSTTDCIYTPEEAAAAPQLFGYAVDGYPIYTGNDQYTSSWMLTDGSLFATDTWAAHSYVEGSGDLDECNGLTDENGNYAYYTTDTFPYVIGCFAGEVDLAGSGAGGGGGRGEAPAGDDEGAAPAQGNDQGQPPAGDDAGAAPAQGNDQGQPPAGEGAAPAQGNDQGQPPAGDDGAAGGGGGGGGGGGRVDFTEAAAALGVTVEELETLLSDRPPDFDAAAAALGVSVEELEAILPAPPG